MDDHTAPPAVRPSVRTDDLQRALDVCGSTLRHPRSLYRSTPAWRPPVVTVTAGSARYRLCAARRRIPRELWVSLSRRSPDAVPPDGESLYLVSLAATALPPAPGTPSPPTADPLAGILEVLDLLTTGVGHPVAARVRRSSPCTAIRHHTVTGGELAVLGRQFLPPPDVAA
ncbi:hypothetical protein [Corynebacterium terpenotabidum]|uniref:hypothetical protein n=1 Tax=Corynebacterium terpenotabidum TaxID=89154 RepID=UPI0005A14F4A|nr:hypothetical protein [Corynebacterium terpenotabidum]